MVSNIFLLIFKVYNLIQFRGLKSFLNDHHHIIISKVYKINIAFSS